MSCGQIPAACPALIWGEVMRIMSKEGRGSLALVQLGPTAPWDTGQTGHKGPSLPGLFTLQGEREQGAERESRGQRWWWMREQQGTCSGQGWKAGVRLVVRGSRCWQRDRLCQQEPECIHTVPDGIVLFTHAQGISSEVSQKLPVDWIVHEQEIRTCDSYVSSNKS